MVGVVETRVIAGLALAVVALGGVAYAFGGDTPTGQASAAELESFAQCLTDEGATMYGVYTCKFCKQQKAMFGSAVDELDYVECADIPEGQPALCREKEISGTPTWIIDGDERLRGKQSFQALADATGCTPP